MVARHWLYFGAFVVNGLLVLGAALLGLVDALSVLSGGVYYGEEFIVLAMLGEAAEWIGAVLVFGSLAAAFLAATVVSVLRRASLPRSDRLVALVEFLERRYPILRRFDVAETVAPTTEDRKRQLREEYVAGDISEAEFERRMERLLDEDGSDERSRSGTAIELED